MEIKKKVPEWIKMFEKIIDESKKQIEKEKEELLLKFYKKI